MTWNKVFGESVKAETGECAEQCNAGETVKEAAAHGVEDYNSRA